MTTWIRRGNIYFTLNDSATPNARVVELADSLDSGSSVHYARAGSSPASRTKKERHLRKADVFLFYSAAQRIEILGRSEFTLRQNARTAQMRRRPEGRSAISLVAVSIIENIDFNRPLQKRHDVCRVFFFPIGGLRTALAFGRGTGNVTGSSNW